MRARHGDDGPGRCLVCKPHSNLCNSGAPRRPAIGRGACAPTRNNLPEREFLWGDFCLPGETTLHRRGRHHCSSLGVGLGGDDTRRLGIAPTSRPVAGTSEPCRTSHQHGRQADRAHRLCAPRGRVGRDHDRHLQGSRPRPQRGAGDDSTRPPPAIAALSPRLGHGIGGCGGRLRPACASRRASRVDDHHAAVDRGDCTQRGRGPVQPGNGTRHACRSLHWVAGPARPMLPKADILPYGASLQRA